MADAVIFYLFGMVAVLLAMFVTAARSTPRRCRHCQTENRRQARYCARCGRSFEP